MFEEECISHMKSNGLLLRGHLITDGEIHRFSSDSKQNQPDEWYRAFIGVGSKGNPYLTCVYGSWSTGDKFTYKSWENSPHSWFDEQEVQMLQQKIEKRQLEAKASEAEKHDKAAQTAQSIWDEALSVKDDTYLLKKQVKPYGLRCGKYNGHDALIIPLKNIDNELRSLQFIYQESDGKFYKRFLTGGEKHGNFHLIGQITSEMAVCEGYATGATWCEDTGMATVIAFDSGNLEPVIAAIRKKYPSCSVLIVGDDDISSQPNMGRKKALQAASLHNCHAIFPQFPSPGLSSDGEFYTDFNDLHVSSGKEEILRQLGNFRISNQKAPNDQTQSKLFTRKELEDLISQPSDFDELTGPLLEKTGLSPFAPFNVANA
jgi:putative DNA primase/helicase